MHDLEPEQGWDRCHVGADVPSDKRLEAEVGAIVGGHVVRVLRMPFVLAGSHGQA